MTSEEKLKRNQSDQVYTLISEILTISDDFDKKAINGGPVMYNNKDNHFQARVRRYTLLTMLVGKEETQRLMIKNCDLTENWMRRHFNTLYIVGRKLVLGE